MRRILVLSVFAFLFAARVGSAAAPTAPAANPVAAPNAITSFDICAPLDVNALSLSLSNFGAFAFDLSGLFPSGLRFPKGSGDGVVFASGLWLGATVAGSPRVTVAEYSQEYVPGSALFGLPESPELAQLKVYTLKRTYPTAAERDAALDSYNNNAVSRGAPVVTVQPDGSLNVPGDEMRCAVYNDLTGSAHNNGAGATTPLQVEVQQTTWAYDRPGPFGNSVFIRFKIINRGPITLNDMPCRFGPTPTWVISRTTWWAATAR